LNQVWTNLINNAAYAIDYRGTIEISANQTNKHVSVKIKESGKGIPKDIADRIFDPFFTTKPRGEGTGIGLDIVKKIIDKHNGTIEFESSPGKGTEFTITIPV
ncbi:MAG: GHKL domain-containing protein, partial [Bacteroidetes bacterium]|nr:GHKL domain-containing protein [Bacteroidota bacterium]